MVKKVIFSLEANERLRDIVYYLIDEWSLKHAKKFLSILDNKIKYLYLPDVANSRPIVDLNKLGMVNIFENSQVAIWARR